MKQEASLFTRLARLPARTLVVVFVLSVGVNIVALLVQYRVKFPPAKHYTYLHHDHPRHIPMGELRTVNMDFHDDIEHYPLNGTQGWAEWNNMHPPGRGALYLGESYWPYQVSMWHQIHCLGHLRALIANGDDGSEHTEHCFHYLRKALLCGGDTTLEEVGQGTVLEGQRQTATGEHIVHTCKDWSQVYEWHAEEHEKWTPEMEQRIYKPAPPVD
ncbi:hypothetical protein BV25DRAFT_1828454 [Artomyces pyxidatus]|uniref:Uncharacterized protein n=1 Tax=Artomyces pyxidatus TaxID=48021 RepID=A0ACB8SV80_9AGAM|nr:hypothetical protein BV25DRAFT_1828454 [Artomyces pyxidatus]